MAALVCYHACTKPRVSGFRFAIWSCARLTSCSGLTPWRLHPQTNLQTSLMMNLQTSLRLMNLLRNIRMNLLRSPRLKISRTDGCAPLNIFEDHSDLSFNFGIAGSPAFCTLLHFPIAKRCWDFKSCRVVDKKCMQSKVLSAWCFKSSERTCMNQAWYL